VACLIIVSLQVQSFENLSLDQSIWRLEEFSGGGGGGLFDYSVPPGPVFLEFDTEFLGQSLDLDLDIGLDFNLDTGPDLELDNSKIL